MKTVIVQRAESKPFKKNMKSSDALVVKLINGLEDIRAGRIKLWKAVKH